MKVKWLHIVIVGVSLAAMIGLLSISRHRFMLMGDSPEWYVMVVAVLFLGVGIWAGLSAQRKVERDQARQISDAVGGGLDAGSPGELSDRELEVLVKISKGLTNQEIAKEMFVSVNTVKTHASNIFSKLNVSRRMQAVQRAEELGILTRTGEKGAVEG